jgi:putative SOS response-associated peptidase YedK
LKFQGEIATFWTMCGRFTLSSELNEFANGLGVTFDAKGHTKRFNICPSQEVAVVLNDGSDKITFARWGLIPSWSKDPSIGNRLANARSEGIESKPSFRTPFKKRRCLVLADGFYEWANRPGQKLKIPYYFRLTSHEVFGFAAIWDVWTDPSSMTEIVTCCLITTQANGVVEKVHERMPVILQERFYKIWLSNEEQPTDRLHLCLEPYPAAKMESYPVSTIVNKPQNDSPECIKPTPA